MFKICSLATIMDKSLGTNLDLWCFFTHAKQTVTREFNYTCSAPPPPSPYNVGHFSRVSTLYGAGRGGGAETNFEKHNSAFSNSVFKRQIIQAGILSTIVGHLLEISYKLRCCFFFLLEIHNS